MKLEKAGWDDGQILDFDLGMLWFGDWIDAKKSEQVWVKQTDEHKGMSPQPKHKNMGEIFELYDETRGMTKFAAQAVVPVADVDAVIEAAYGDEILF